MFYSPVRWVPLLFGIMLAFAVSAQDSALGEQYYVVDIELQTVEEFWQLLERAEQLLLAGMVLPAGGAKVTFVVHGPVLRNMLRQNYLDNKKMVDLAASLSAMEVIDIKACRAWMRSNGVSEEDLPPFVETVAYGPAVVELLLKEKNYIYF